MTEETAEVPQLDYSERSLTAGRACIRHLHPVLTSPPEVIAVRQTQRQRGTRGPASASPPACGRRALTGVRGGGRSTRTTAGPGRRLRRCRPGRRRGRQLLTAGRAEGLEEAMTAAQASHRAYVGSFSPSRVATLRALWECRSG